MDSRDSSRFFSIDSSLPFLQTLAETLLNGELFPGYVPANDPLLLAKATVYVPTRRAARALTSEFMGLLKRDAVILPRILTIGDGDDMLEGEGLAIDVSPAIGALERQLQLARFIQGWTNALSRETKALFGEENILIPTSTSDAIWLSKQLGALLDQIETAEVPYEKILGLEVGEQSQWWNLTTAFLQILLEHWPQYLSDHGLVDPSVSRRLTIDRRTIELAGRLETDRANDPVIVAGSTGSVASTARFMKAVLGLPSGAIVLPGLDFTMNDASFASLLDPQGTLEQATMPAHPQFGLAKLLKDLGVARKNVHRLGGVGDDVLENRMAVVSQAMLPSRFCEEWQQGSLDAKRQSEIDKAFGQVSLVEARSERQEAISIALAMRSALEIPGKTASLVTPNRDLARRVSLELKRFGIDVDDSGGESLGNTLCGGFARLTLSLMDNVLTGQKNPPALAAFIKHPLMRCGLEADVADRLSRLLELVILRGRIDIPQPGEFARFVSWHHDRVADEKYLPAPVKAMDDNDWQGLLKFAEKLDAAMTLLLDAIRGAEAVEPAAMASRLRQCLLLLSEDENGDATLFESEEGISLSQWFDQLLAPNTELQSIPAADMAKSLDALLGGIQVRGAGSSHPRLHIFGPLEARLQQPDLVILASLNEGTWPKSSQNDPFLNRLMKMSLGIDSPERRVGLSAHDFQQMMGTTEVILSRSERVDNVPSIPSRWLQRLLTVIGEDAAKQMRARGKVLLAMGERVERVDLEKGYDAGPMSLPEAKQPRPKPPVHIRPSKMPVTDIETWIRDPYAIYAKRILELYPLPPITREADPMLRGTVYHDALAEFQRRRDEWIDLAHSDEAGAARKIADFLMDCVEDQLAGYNVPADAALFWRHRMAEVAELVAQWEIERANTIENVEVEIEGETEIGDTGFALRGRADRIDTMADGTVEIYDYKTGNHPSQKLARTLSPQLSLEGLIAEQNGFGKMGPATVGAMAYVRLKQQKSLKVDQPKTKDISVEDLINGARDRLTKLIGAYQDPEQGYLSRYAPHKESEMSGDYDHLARVREWSISDDGDDGEESADE